MPVDLNALKRMSETFPTPWRIESTRFGESMSRDSRSRIVDASGRQIVTLGGALHLRDAEAEALAQLIVSAVNKASP